MILSFQFAGCLLEGRLERSLQSPFEPEKGSGRGGVLRLPTFPGFVVPCYTSCTFCFSLSQNCCAHFLTLQTYSRWLKRACRRAHVRALSHSFLEIILNMVAEPCCSSEQISERICEQIADVHVPQVVGQVLEAPKISSKDRNLQGTVEQIPDVLVPEMVEQLVKLSKTASVDRIQERTAEQTVDILGSAGCGGTDRVLQGFLPGQGSTEFCGAGPLKLPILFSVRRSSSDLSLRRNRL